MKGRSHQLRLRDHRPYIPRKGRKSEDLGWRDIHDYGVGKLHEVVGHSVGQSAGSEGGSEGTGGSSSGSTWMGSIITSSSSLATDDGGSTILPSDLVGAEMKGATDGAGVGPSGLGDSVGTAVTSTVVVEGVGDGVMSGMVGAGDGEGVGPSTLPSFVSSSSGDPSACWLTSTRSVGWNDGLAVGSSVGSSADSFGNSSSDPSTANK
jgi:hypothetical protein